MTDLRRSMKQAIILGLSGAVLIPVLYEIYANVSMGMGLILLTVWMIFAGIKFSGMTFKEALIGITCTLAYSGILGFVCSLAIHPAVMDMLVKRSVYFRLGLQGTIVFIVYALVISLLMYVIWIIRFFIRKTVEKFRSNSEKAGEYIENAFNDVENDR